MTNMFVDRRPVLALAGLCGMAVAQFEASPASAGKSMFQRSKPHVAASQTADGGRLSGGAGATARKWCGPGGRLCIEDGRWTWKKKKKK